MHFPSKIVLLHPYFSGFSAYFASTLGAFGSAITIPANGDMNNYADTCLLIISGANASSIRNLPSGVTSSSRAFVISIGGFALQFFVTTTLFFRLWDGGAWRDWVKFTTQEV